MTTKIKMGHAVKDAISGFSGIVVSIHEFMNGCRRITTITIRDVEQLHQDLRSVAVIFPARCKWSRKRGVYRWRKSRRYGFAGLLGWKDIEQRESDFVMSTITPWLSRHDEAPGLHDLRREAAGRLISSSPKNEQSES